MNAHEIYMRRCLELAERGLGYVAPNPMVGCVIVHHEKIIAEGYHQKYGEAHAEVNALKHISDESILPECTLYVSLEPCSHYGKTPPCSDLIIAKKIKKVVIGCTDSNPLVAGKGIEKLSAAGIEVITGVLEKEGRELNKRFFTFFEKKRPYIILKWAQAKDGFISRNAPFTREENWITGVESQRLVHEWRAQEQAILVGTNTALADNPQLTVRLAEGKNPLRVLIDKNLRTPATNTIFSPAAETLVFNAISDKKGNNVTFKKIAFSQDIIPQILDELYHRKIISIIIEGGTHTLQSFISQGLWDEARVFEGNKIFSEGIKAPVFPASAKPVSTKLIGEDVLFIYRISN